MSNSAAASRLRASTAAMAVGLVALLASASAASAATYTATNGSQLNAAFVSANLTTPGQEDTIRLVGQGPWVLNTPVTITDDVVVTGRLNSSFPAQQNAINGGTLPPGTDTFTINPGVRAVFKSLVITQSSDLGPFAVFRNRGTLLVVDAGVSGNAGQALQQDAAAATATFVNATLSDSPNQAIAAILGTVTLRNSTVADNQGGIDATSLTLQNTALTRNLLNCFNPATVVVTSIDDDGSCGATTADPQLGFVQSNGGPSGTLLPAAGSPVINAGTNSLCPSVDQRGFLRTGTGNCDIGSVEDGATIRDTTPPSCGVTAVRPGPPRQQDVATQDLQSGLFRTFEPFVTNGSVALGAVSFYTQASVTSTATKTTAGTATRWGFLAEDISNNLQDCQ